jgi:RimJ/RimL family protein N-acetyltransferase
MTSVTYTIPAVETGRLILRAPHRDDLQPMADFFATERSHYVGGPRDTFATWQSFVSRLGHWMLNGYGLWHLTEKATGAFIGWTGFIFAPGWQEPELGWTLFEQAEGKGLATEACRAARSFGAQRFGLDRVVSHIDPANSRSLALAERVGAVHECDSELMGKPCQNWRHPSVLNGEAA